MIRKSIENYFDLPPKVQLGIEITLCVFVLENSSNGN